MAFAKAHPSQPNRHKSSRLAGFVFASYYQVAKTRTDIHVASYRDALLISF